MPEFDTLLQYRLDDDDNQDEFRESVVQDYWICCVSREVSLLGRREVLSGKAKFGILGDGKEVPQVALARAWRKGDWRAGYYRDQTMMFALGLATVEQYFAQLYADSENDPWSGGRQMNAHFATPMVDDQGNWINQQKQYNVSSDISPTGGQMGRAIGLALASKYYRQADNKKEFKKFSNGGNEVCFCTIGDASTSEGVFWETMNASAVMQVPLAVSVWDDGYGISVPRDLQTVKSSISKAMAGFASDEDGPGIDIYNAKAWDYPGLCAMYDRGIERVRKTHIPALFHIEACTQPQGHSTSGSHERYKSKDRLAWEESADCIMVMGQWMIESGVATAEELESIHSKAKEHVREAKTRAWMQFNDPSELKRQELLGMFDKLSAYIKLDPEIGSLRAQLHKAIEPHFAEIVSFGRKLHHKCMHLVDEAELKELLTWLDNAISAGKSRYDTFLYSSDQYSALRVPVIPPEYDEESKKLNGYQILNYFFDKILEGNPEVVAFGEDVGQIGDVNQGFAGLQDKYGVERVFDTGIREWTIMGQAIGMAMRGLRPIAEIQYLDYLIYGMAPLTDDLATLRYRSNGIQQAPAIIRTRGHRLEGIWHTGSPLGMVLNALRGLYVCVPRNMVQAAGMYNTLLRSNDPAIVIECLNGYRKKELLPNNTGEYTIPLGVPDILLDGSDITIVSYGSVLHEIMAAAGVLKGLDISVEVIDVQTLLPFDLEGVIAQSLKKTSRVIFVDEDVPGGASAYMMQQVLEVQAGYAMLDSGPKCVTGGDHRSAYGSDGDYFTKPGADDIVEVVYQMMHETNPDSYPVNFAN
jgi:pyruvate/2-oxoglutarate/acetoin dehydrogenase E1 component/TPP-dependent pyruvate/acetoin dehydrogenase alpha subunit